MTLGCERAAETDRRIGESAGRRIGVSAYRRVGVGAQLLIRNRARYRSRARPVAVFFVRAIRRGGVMLPTRQYADTPTRRYADPFPLRVEFQVSPGDHLTGLWIETLNTDLFEDCLAFDLLTGNHLKALDRFALGVITLQP